MLSPAYFDLNVHIPEGSSIEEYLCIARRLGYSGLAITGPDTVVPVEHPVSVDGFGVLSGVEIRTDNVSKLHGAIGRYRDKVDVLVVAGGSEAMNRAAVSNAGVDVLIGLDTGPESGFNQVLAKEASQNQVAISFDIGHIIHSKGGSRVQALGNCRRNLQLVRKYNVPFIITSSARSCYDLRAPRELGAVAKLFGMSAQEVTRGLSEFPLSIIARNRPSPGYLADGVQLVHIDAPVVQDGGEYR